MLESGLVEDGRATSGGVGKESSKSFGGSWGGWNWKTEWSEHKTWRCERWKGRRVV
jgi:hypothetical protein